MTIKVATEWADVTLDQLEQLAALSDVEAHEFIKAGKAVAILSDLTEAQVMNLPWNEVVGVYKRLTFLGEPIPKYIPERTLTLDGRKFHVTTSLLEITAAQFIDMKTMLADGAPLRKLCATCIIPDGHTYGDGYDFEDVAAFLGAHLSAVEGRGIADFFAIQSQTFIERSLNSLEERIAKVKPQTATETAAKEEAMEGMKQARAAVSQLVGGR